jgi:hypothetical protein
MKNSAHSQKSIAERIILGLSVGCTMLLLTEFLLRMDFKFSLSSLAAAKLWDATAETLFISWMVLLIASGVVSFYRPRVAFWGMIVGVVALLVGVSTPSFIYRF